MATDIQNDLSFKKSYDKLVSGTTSTGDEKRIEVLNCSNVKKSEPESSLKLEVGQDTSIEIFESSFTRNKKNIDDAEGVNMNSAEADPNSGWNESDDKLQETQFRRKVKWQDPLESRTPRRFTDGNLLFPRVDGVNITTILKNRLQSVLSKKSNERKSLSTMTLTKKLSFCETNVQVNPKKKKRNAQKMVESKENSQTQWEVKVTSEKMAQSQEKHSLISDKTSNSTKDKIHISKIISDKACISSVKTNVRIGVKSYEVKQPDETCSAVSLVSEAPFKDKEEKISTNRINGTVIGYSLDISSIQYPTLSGIEQYLTKNNGVTEKVVKPTKLETSICSSGMITRTMDSVLTSHNSVLFKTSVITGTSGLEKMTDINEHNVEKENTSRNLNSNFSLDFTLKDVVSNDMNVTILRKRNLKKMIGRMTGGNRTDMNRSRRAARDEEVVSSALALIDKLETTKSQAIIKINDSFRRLRLWTKSSLLTASWESELRQDPADEPYLVVPGRGGTMTALFPSVPAYKLPIVSTPVRQNLLAIRNLIQRICTRPK